MNTTKQRQRCNFHQSPRHTSRALRRQSGRLRHVARRGRGNAQKLSRDDIVRCTPLVCTVVRCPHLLSIEEIATSRMRLWRGLTLGGVGRKYQFMEANTQRRLEGLKEKVPDIQKTLDMVRFLETRKVRLTTLRRQSKLGARLNVFCGEAQLTWDEIFNW